MVTSLNEQCEEAAHRRPLCHGDRGNLLRPDTQPDRVLSRPSVALIFRAESQTWGPLVGVDSSDHSQSNMPFGILGEQNLASADTTVVLARANSERVSVKDNVLAPFRLLRGLFS